MDFIRQSEDARLHGRFLSVSVVNHHPGQMDAVRVLLDAGADPTIRDAIHGGMADGWADFGGHPEIAAYLRGLR